MVKSHKILAFLGQMFPFAFSFLIIDSLLLFKIMSEYRRQVLAFLVSKRFYACMMNKEDSNQIDFADPGQLYTWPESWYHICSEVFNRSTLQCGRQIHERKYSSGLNVQNDTEEKTLVTSSCCRSSLLVRFVIPEVLVFAYQPLTSYLQT